jgi:hypothetical protein
MTLRTVDAEIAGIRGFLKKMRNSFYKSIAFHLLPLLLLIQSTKTGDGDKDSDNGKLPKKDPIVVDIIPKKNRNDEQVNGDNKVSELKKTVPHFDKQCTDSYYGGVGIEIFYFVTNDMDQGARVGDAIEGYPAYEAGIRAGDYILNPEELRGEIGTQVTIHLTNETGTKSWSVTLYRDKICTEPKK